MPTPTFTFRLPRADQEALAEMAKLYGSKNSSEFARELVGVMCSGDMERIKTFNGRLIARMGEQLTLKFNAAVDSANAVNAKAKAKAKRRRRDRPT